MAVYGFLNPGIPGADGMYTMFLYSLCRQCCLAEGHERMGAGVESRVSGSPTRWGCFPDFDVFKYAIR
jgi:hypothetical protein